MFTLKGWVVILFSVIAMSSIVFILVLFRSEIRNILQSEPKKLVAPVNKSGITLGVNQWFPKSVLGAQSGTSEITAKSAFFVDTKSGDVLYSKNPHERLPVASLVKVMTALIAVEHRGLDESYVVSERAAAMEPDKMWLMMGEKLTLKELLYGIFLISANDAAETLAEGTTGRREEFLNMMNGKAAQLGLNDTFFVNPTGLDEDSGNSYSSTYDLSVLARYAIRNHPFLVDFSKTEHIVLPITESHQDYDMYSGINLLTSYPGVVGFKTGYTPEAGLTLITIARRNGREVIGVLLGSSNRREEAKELLDFSFKKLGV